MSRKIFDRRSGAGKAKPRVDYLLLTIVICLSLFGVLMVYNASVVEAHREFLDKFYFARQQLLWTAIGIGLMFVISRFPVKFFLNISLWAFLATTTLLLFILIPGVGTQTLGARRWLNLGILSLQPAEFAKLTLAMYLASLLTKRRYLAQFTVTVLVVVGLVLLEPALGTALVIAMLALVMLFFAGAPWRFLLPTLAIGTLTVVVFIVSSQYRKARVMTYLNPQADPLGASYHIRQVLIALGSGGIFGVGLGQSRQKYQYIPEATTDSIFAILAEEVGFVGSVVVIGLYAVFLVRAFRIVRLAPDPQSQLLAGGITAWIGSQTLLNLATMVALVPLTGVPLPFISYGGSSTIATLTGVGLLLSISRHATKTA